MVKSRARIRTIPLGMSGIGSKELVAAPSSVKNVVVVSYLVVMDGAGTFKFRSGATDISDAIPCEDKGGVAMKGDYSTPALSCAPGEALSIVTAAGVARGHLTYYLDG